VAAGSTAVPKERLEVFAGTHTAILDDYRSLELFQDRFHKRQSGKQDKGHVNEVREFLDGIRLGTSPIPLDELANVSLAALAVVESLRTGATVRIGPTSA
jgi:hypothetical protein